MAFLSFLYSVYVTPKNTKAFTFIAPYMIQPISMLFFLLCQKLAILSHTIHTFLLLLLYNSQLPSTVSRGLEGTMQSLFLTMLIVIKGFYFSTTKAAGFLSQQPHLKETEILPQQSHSKPVGILHNDLS
jgi:hypothetical protein